MTSQYRNRKEYRRVILHFDRLKRFFLLCTIFILCISLGFHAAASSMSEKNEPAYEEILVKSGDTLWDLAQKYYHGDDDIRKVIHFVREINCLDQSLLQPGQIIKIPTK